MIIRHGQITIDNVGWTPIKPITSDCDQVIINNITNVALKLRTTLTDPTSEYVLQSLLEYPIDAPKNSFIGLNDTLMFGQLASGTATIQVRCKAAA